MSVAQLALPPLAWLTTFTTTRCQLPEGPVGSSAAGGFGGMALALASNATKAPALFPDSVAETRMRPPLSPMQRVTKGTIGSACFFTVFEGLRNIVKRKQEQQEDKSSSSAAGKLGTDFMAGAVGSIALRAATINYAVAGPIEISAKLAVQHVGHSCLAMGLVN